MPGLSGPLAEAAGDGAVMLRDSTPSDVALMQRLGVRYVFSGHRHTYARRPPREGDMVFVSSGQGGDMRASRLHTDDLVYWTRVTVDADGIRDERMSFRPEMLGATRARFLAVTAVHPVASAAIGLLLLAFVVRCTWRLIATLRAGAATDVPRGREPAAAQRSAPSRPRPLSIQ